MIEIAAMLFLGLLAHHLLLLGNLTLVKKKDTGNLFTWYIRERPVKLILSIIFSIAGAVMLHEYNQLTLTTAFFAGLSSDALIDRFGKMVAVRK